ncbi:hypothetical protein PoB_000278300 [Plakobranchus ocellatus]|uniref:Uncharacterized protein n=1 Tax=Plakobranchus ocellatus TaxID=259542 RepID=A0AAV3Y0V8_9GAST|nr:hypothetical protein PoB_000278300 [Plakobranchus ocellatus]
MKGLSGLQYLLDHQILLLSNISNEKQLLEYSEIHFNESNEPTKESLIRTEKKEGEEEDWGILDRWATLHNKVISGFKPSVRPERRQCGSNPRQMGPADFRVGSLFTMPRKRLALEEKPESRPDCAVAP